MVSLRRRIIDLRPVNASGKIPRTKGRAQTSRSGQYPAAPSASSAGLREGQGTRFVAPVREIKKAGWPFKQIAFITERVVFFSSFPIFKVATLIRVWARRLAR